MKKTIITLDCGISAEVSVYKKVETLSISLYDVYSGYGRLNDLAKMAELFKELDSKGYKGAGIYIQTGYYDSVDDLILTVNRRI